MAIQDPADLRQIKTRLTPALADYLFVESHQADSPIAKSWEYAADQGTIEYGIAHPNTVKYPDHILVYVGSERESKQGKVVDFYYAAIGTEQDTYNWVYTGYSGSKYKQFTRKYLILRDVITDEVVIPLNTPDTVATDFVLFDTRLTTTGSKVLDSVYVMRESTYIKIEILKGTTYDPRLKESYDYQETIVFGDFHITTNNGGLDYTAPLLPQADPINASWTNVRTRRRGDAEDFTTRSYFTYQNYSWPPVLKRLGLYPISTKAGVEPEKTFIVQDEYVRQGFSGATKTLVTETLYVDEDWSTPPTPDAVPEPMIPESIQARGVFSSVGVGPTLHPSVTFSETRGTTSPWANGTTTWTFDATNYTDWPNTLLIQSSISPTEKGWIKVNKTVYKPGT